jgi:hypothetical protein
VAVRSKQKHEIIFLTLYLLIGRLDLAI